MAFELDHLFICTDIGAWEADLLIAFGLLEGSSNIHPGQGTTNRRFFFYNAMLELLWVSNPEEAKSEPIHRTRLWDRWINRKNGACPFGVCLRTAASDDEVAFSSWTYCPPYLPEAVSIKVGTNSDLLIEPMLFQIPFGKRPDRYPLEISQPLEHNNGWKEITRVELISPWADNVSPEFQAVIDTNQIQLRKGMDYCVELGFDGEKQEQLVDFRPGLPLVMSW